MYSNINLFQNGLLKATNNYKLFGYSPCLILSAKIGTTPPLDDYMVDTFKSARSTTRKSGGTFGMWLEFEYGMDYTYSGLMIGVNILKDS